MPGRNPAEAFRAFIDPLADAIGCIARVKCGVTKDGRASVGEVHGLYLTGQGNEYASLSGKPRLQLRARMRYMIIEDDRPGYGPFRVTTVSYDYSICDEGLAAVLDYHWHPVGESHAITPHVHVGTSQLKPDAVLSKRDHLPTGRMTFESVVRGLVDLGVKPLCNDWEQRVADLTKAEQLHVRHRTWH